MTLLGNGDDRVDDDPGLLGDPLDRLARAEFLARGCDRVAVSVEALARRLDVEAQPRRQDARVWAASCTDGETSRGRPGSAVANTAASHAAAAARANSVA